MSFSDDIKKFANKTEQAALFVFRGSSLGVFNKVIIRTPVDTGRLRGNWQASLSGPLSGEVDSGGGAALNQASRVTSGAKITDSIYMVNNLPYAGVIEDGSSKQAPLGMVKVTISEYQRIVAENARKVRK